MLCNQLCASSVASIYEALVSFLYLSPDPKSRTQTPVNAACVVGHAERWGIMYISSIVSFFLTPSNFFDHHPIPLEGAA
jgi:hypothetical protein